jgi:hypothetical protein
VQLGRANNVDLVLFAQKSIFYFSSAKNGFINELGQDQKPWHSLLK